MPGLPWQSHPQTRVMIEVTVDDPVLRPVQRKRVIREYGEPLDADVQVYSLEEVGAVKLRAILQQADMFEKRGWSRSRGRDYYDLWQVLDTCREQMDLADFRSLSIRSALYEMSVSRAQRASSTQGCSPTLEKLGSSGLAHWCRGFLLSRQ